MKRLILALTLCVSCCRAAEPVWKHEELRRFHADEANQGVVADDGFLYVITNSAIGKYRKDTGERVGGWKGAHGGPIAHLNAGIIHAGKLYCAHSNYPTIPSTSSIEIFDPATMKHIGSQSLGLAPGSLTWVARKDNTWFACFARYAKDKETTGQGSAFTEVVQFDDQWRRMAGWVFPPDLIVRFGRNSSSCGGFGIDGLLFITGHDEKELYVLRFPEAGSVLDWIGTVPISAEGQAFSWDPKVPGLFYGIIRSSKEVVVSRITRE